MGLFKDINSRARKQVEEKRAIGGVPWQPFRPWDDPFFPFSAGGPVHPSQMVYPKASTEGSLALTALCAGTRILAANAASLPLKIYQSDASGAKSRYTGPSLFDKPSVNGTVNTWVFQLMVNLILAGECWGLVTGRDGFGYPTGIEWIEADKVQVEEAEDGNILNARVFVFGRQVEWRGSTPEVVHVTSFPMPGKLRGLSLIRANAATLAHGRSAQEYGLGYFQTGGQAHSSFQNTELEVDANQSAIIRRQLTSSVRNHEPLVFGRDWDYKTYPVSAEEAQFLETMKVTATQIASLLFLPPEMLGGDKGYMTYSSTIQSQLQVTEALRLWLAIIESAMSEWIPNRRTVQFDVRAMLRLAPNDQATYWTALRDAGFITADEVRTQELDMPALPSGVGAEELPLSVLTELARAGAAIPKSWAKLLEAAPAPAPQPEPVTSPATNPADNAQQDNGQESEAA